ncbi:uncharacterized protein LOC111643447 [Copidosoma floridanum]|uniref:uncharacterized protein LOC111643447 n=1 Tax=Copidosoma floridanum TaxID=29053 RepID=UPI000C6F5D75|nr:uncharacterized protein LOC111643447 [Copidosoma floridanum]
MADILSRGQSPIEFMQNRTWFEGHPWIRQSSDTWQKSRLNMRIELPGIRKSACLLAALDPEPFYKKLSSFSVVITTGAYCMRLFKRFRVAERPKTSTVTSEERLEVERRLLRAIQLERFSVEIKLLRNERNLSYTKIAALSPFLDEHGLLRVGGRLGNSQIPYTQKHPILLPSRHYVTDLIIRETHGKLLHAGIQNTLYQLRLKYWILDGKNQVRKIIRSCVTCIRHRPIPVQCKMGDLPKARVTQAEIFDRVGVDFLGPISIKEKKERNRVVLKAYGCIFVCMVTKAVHIEIATDLSTDTFLASFRRFISRRGRPSHVYSDNGTNFVGANNKLCELYESYRTEQHQKQVSGYALSEGIKWHFNPPLAPHFGGLWEASVKSFKHHFERVAGGKLLTFEQLDKLAKEIKAILNSRPICTISNDPNDSISLTLAHFIIGRPITMAPEHDYTSVSENRLSVWNLVTKARQDFWKRWHIECLDELQKRQKWLRSEGSIKIGSIVIIIDKKQPCCEWLLGRVIEISPGSDGVVGVAKVKTSQGVYIRSVTKLCPLPNRRAR